MRLCFAPYLEYHGNISRAFSSATDPFSTLLTRTYPEHFAQNEKAVGSAYWKFFLGNLVQVNTKILKSYWAAFLK